MVASVPLRSQSVDLENSPAPQIQGYLKASHLQLGPELLFWLHMPNHSFPVRRFSPKNWHGRFPLRSFWASSPGLSQSLSCPGKTQAGSLSRSSLASSARSSAVFSAASSVSGRSSRSTSAGFSSPRRHHPPDRLSIAQKKNLVTRGTLFCRAGQKIRVGNSFLEHGMLSCE